jgi:hypothetical protein
VTEFPVDAPKRQVIAAFERLGFRLVRERKRMAMVREEPGDARTPLTLPNRSTMKASTLRTGTTSA